MVGRTKDGIIRKVGTSSSEDAQSGKRGLWDQRNPVQSFTNPEMVGQFLKPLTVKRRGVERGRV